MTYYRTKKKSMFIQQQINTTDLIKQAIILLLIRDEQKLQHPGDCSSQHREEPVSFVHQSPQSYWLVFHELS